MSGIQSNAEPTSLANTLANHLLVHCPHCLKPAPTPHYSCNRIFELEGDIIKLNRSLVNLLNRIIALEEADMPELQTVIPPAFAPEMKPVYLVLNAAGGGTTLASKFDPWFLDAEAHFSSDARQQLKGLRLQERGIDRASTLYKDSVADVVAKKPQAIIIRVHSYDAVPVGAQYAVMPVTPMSENRIPHGQRNAAANYQELKAIERVYDFKAEEVHSWVRMYIRQHLAGHHKDQSYLRTKCKEEIVD